VKLYRAMKVSADGLPEVGPTARSLGVRAADQAPHNDVPAAAPTDSITPGTGGMSVTPNDPMNLPKQRRPAALGGTGKDPVWEIDDADLGSGLQFRQDKPTHGLIEVKDEMALADYEQALAATRDKWKRVVG
jgi:hypothetical protein